jgi:hypothetical protein
LSDPEETIRATPPGVTPFLIDPTAAHGLDDVSQIVIWTATIDHVTAVSAKSLGQLQALVRASALAHIAERLSE